MPRMGFTDMVRFALTKGWENIIGFIKLSLFTIFVPTVLLNFLSNMVQANVESMVFETTQFGTTTITPATAVMPLWFWPAFTILTLVIIIASLIYNAATIYYAKGIIMSEKVDVMKVLEMAKTKIVPVFITGILMGIALILLAFLLIIPALIFGLLWAFAMQAVVLDDKQGVEALKHSFNIVKPRFVKALLYAIALGVIFWILGFIVGIPVGIFGVVITGIFGVAGQFGTAIAAVIMAVITSLISAYFTGAGVVFQTHLYMQWNDQPNAAKKVTEKVEEVVEDITE